MARQQVGRLLQSVGLIYVKTAELLVYTCLHALGKLDTYFAGYRNVGRRVTYIFFFDASRLCDFVKKVPEITA